MDVDVHVHASAKPSILREAYGAQLTGWHGATCKRSQGVKRVFWFYRGSDHAPEAHSQGEIIVLEVRASCNARSEGLMQPV
eukprot:1160894-Pelagomonas_calceolata.AAC.21